MGHDRVYRFHMPHAHLSSPFGDGWFALKAEAFARFFGTPLFLVVQTVIVAVWIVVNIVGWWVFDVYPFILLNLAFSLQAAYAAPLILLAQTRQADRDKCTAMADAQHREDLHQASEARERAAMEQTALLVRMVEQNTRLTETAKAMAERIESLTVELHRHILEIKAVGNPALRRLRLGHAYGNRLRLHHARVRAGRGVHHLRSLLHLVPAAACETWCLDSKSW